MKLSAMTPLIGLTATTLFTGMAAAQESHEAEIQRIEIRDGEEMNPEATIKRVEQELREYTAGRRREENGRNSASAWQIGARIDVLDPLLRTHLNIPEDTGILVRGILENSPAAKAGIKANDIIVSVGDHPVTTPQSLISEVQRAAAAGKTLELSIIHEGKRRVVRIEPPTPEPARPQASDRGTEKSGPNPERIANALKQRDRQIEEMRGQIKRLSHALEKQQKQIKALEMKLGESGKVKDLNTRADSTLAKPGASYFVPVKHLDVEKAASQVRSAMDGSLQIIPEPRTRRLLMMGDKEKVLKAVEVLKSIDVEAPAVGRKVDASSFSGGVD